MRRGWLYRLAYPYYECEDCIGVCFDGGHFRGCYCDYYKAYGPCDDHGRWWNRAARWLHTRLKERERDE